MCPAHIREGSTGTLAAAYDIGTSVRPADTDAHISVGHVRPNRWPRRGARPPGRLGGKVERCRERGTRWNRVRKILDGARDLGLARANRRPSGVGRTPAPPNGRGRDVVIPPTHESAGSVGIAWNSIPKTVSINLGAGGNDSHISRVQFVILVRKGCAAEDIPDDVVKARKRINKHRGRAAAVCECPVILLESVVGVTEDGLKLVRSVEVITVDSRADVPFVQDVLITDGVKETALILPGVAPVVVK